MIRIVTPGPVAGHVRAPPSKSYTHRALVTAFLSSERSVVLGPLDADDTRATADGLARLGASIVRGRDRWTVRRHRVRGRRAVRIDCRESGTTLRLLTAVAALENREVRFTGRGRLPYRPMDPLFEPLRALGATVRRPRRSMTLPFTIRGPIHAGKVEVRAAESSQPVSALLLALAGVPQTSELRLVGQVVSEPYIEATVAWLRRAGKKVLTRRNTLRVFGRGAWKTSRLRMPADASSAAYLWAAAAASRGRVVVDNMDLAWPQADLAIVPLLRSMGATVAIRGRSIGVGGTLTRPVRADLTRSPDLYPLVGAIAALVPRGRSYLRGAEHVRHKESDRREETLQLVRAIGARAGETSHALWIEGTGSPRSLRLTALTDHRLVMSAAVAALAASGPSRIGDASAVGKSFPAFWSTMASLGLRSRRA